MSAVLLSAAEQGLLPTPLVRVGIRRLLRSRLRALGSTAEARAAAEQAFLAQMRTAPIALATEASRQQHYEVPPAFFERVLGPHLKYSACWFETGREDLGTAEQRMLDLTMERAQLADGQRILELGCGWGSLTLAMAARFPAARITAVSHSRPQRAFIEERARARGLANIEVRTCDMNDFEAGARHDRVVSVEMFEHMRNWEALLARVHGWLEPQGRLFLHVFAHRARTYPFEDRGRDDWMARHFFTGGLMPAADLLTRLAIPFQVEQAWTVDGRHYARTAACWRQNLDRERAAVEQVLAEAGAGREAARAVGRWRLFFLACEELFAYDAGREWPVVHARLVPTGGA